MTMIRRGRFYDIYRIEVQPEQENIALSDVILARFEQLSYDVLEQHVKASKILVNGKPATLQKRMTSGDTITALIDKSTRNQVIEPQEIPLDIVFEDEHLLIVNKPVGMVVHPGPSNWSGTLANALVARYDNLPRQRKGEDKPGIVHRIDKDTSGLLVCAKNWKTMEGLSRQFYEHSIDRTYYALIWGIPKYRHGTIEADIRRDFNNKRLRTVVNENMGGKYAITHFKVLEKFMHISLIQCNLETGRTHQIRVHLGHIGHPLFADRLYGGFGILHGNDDEKFRNFAKELLEFMPRQGLHAKSLGFTHPITKKRLFFESELPDDFETVLRKLRAYSNSKQS